MSGKELIEEIARAAGVSRAAAYAALGPNSGKIRVGKATRERIARLAEERGYVKNELASSLATGKTNTIGLCLQSLRSGFFTEFFLAFDECAYNHGYSTMFSSWEFDSERERKIIKSFINKRVDAIVIAGYSAHEMDNDLLKYARTGGTLIFLGDAPLPGFSKIIFDEPGATALQAGYLSELGHTRVAHLNIAASADERVELHANRLRYFSDAWRRNCDTEPLNVTIRDFAGLSRAAATIVAAGVTAVACTNDELAIKLIAVLREQGKNVPADLSVIGLDDIEISEISAPPLTTVRLPTGTLATTAWQELTGKLNRTDAQTRRTVIAPSLVIRQSTARPAAP